MAKQKLVVLEADAARHTRAGVGASVTGTHGHEAVLAAARQTWTETRGVSRHGSVARVENPHTQDLSRITQSDDTDRKSTRLNSSH